MSCNDTVIVTLEPAPTIIIDIVDTPQVVEIATPGPQGPQGPAGGSIQIPTRTVISGHRAIAVDGAGYAIYADATTGTASAYIGISTGAITDNAPVTVSIVGDMIEPSWSWTAGLPVFIGSSGNLTQTAPSGTQRIIGTALSATSIALVPNPGIVTA